jgi:hypothetical protein
MKTDIWECEDCGARSIDGCGAAWTAQDDERFHACPRLPQRLSPRPASRVELDAAHRILLAFVRCIERSASYRGDEGIGEVYADACDALGLTRQEMRP